MDIQYTGHNLEVTPAIRDYADKRFSRLTKHHNKIVHMQVSFHVEHLDQVVKATVSIPGHEVFAQQRSSDLYKSIDLIEDKLITQLDKHK